MRSWFRILPMLPAGTSQRNTCILALCLCWTWLGCCLRAMPLSNGWVSIVVKKNQNNIKQYQNLSKPYVCQILSGSKAQLRSLWYSSFNSPLASQTQPPLVASPREPTGSIYGQFYARIHGRSPGREPMGTPKKYPQSGWISQDIPSPSLIFSTRSFWNAMFAWICLIKDLSSRFLTDFGWVCWITRSAKQEPAASLGKNCHQTTYGQPDVLFREIEKSCEIDPAHFLVI